MYRICVITKQNKNSPKHPAVGIWESWWCLKKGHFRSEFSKCLLLMEGLLDNHFLLWMTFKNSDHMALAGMSPRLMSQVLTPPPPNSMHIKYGYFESIFEIFWSELEERSWVLILESTSEMPPSPSCLCHIINYFMWGSLEVHTVIEFGGTDIYWVHSP